MEKCKTWYNYSGCRLNLCIVNKKKAKSSKFSLKKVKVEDTVWTSIDSTICHIIDDLDHSLSSQVLKVAADTNVYRRSL